MSLRIAYLTAIYPRATDTFIQREVAALRGHGAYVQTFAVRIPPDKEITGPEQRSERAGTKYLLPPRFFEIVRSQLSLFAAGPVRYCRALRTALTVRAAGLKSLLLQLVYFAEAGVVAWDMRRQGIAHVHAHFSSHPGTVVMLAAEMGGLSYSLTIHGSAEFFEPMFWRMDEKVRRAKFVACISHFGRAQVMCFASPDDWHKLHIVHCGVDPALFAPVAHAGGGSRLLFVGRLVVVKGLTFLFEALAEVKRRRPDVKLQVAGDGPDRDRLVAHAREVGVADNVEFLGYRSQAQVRELLGQTDVFVMSSFAEGVPVVLMEAMAAGVPVVATRVGGVPELVEEGVSGYLVPPGAPAPLAARLEQLLADADLRAAFGAAGRRKVEQEFNVNVEAEKLARVMAGALMATPVVEAPSALARSDKRIAAPAGYA